MAVAPFDQLAARGIDRATIAAFGLVATSWHGRPALRYPVRLPDGAAVGQRVKYMDGRRPKAGWVCPPGAATPGDLAPALLYGADLLLQRLTQRLSSLFLVEGEPDVWLLHALGLPAVSLLRGATAASVPDHARYALAQLAPARVYVVYDIDADGTGQRGAWRVTDDLRRAGVTPSVAPLCLPDELGDGGDVTDLYARCGRDPRRFVAALAALPPLPRPTDPARRRRSAEGRPPSMAAAASQGGGDVYAAFKQAHPLAPYVEAVTGRAGRPCGRELVWRCPLPGHDDHTPSFYVNTEKAVFLCRGCGAGGDVITLIQLLHHDVRIGASA